MKATVAALLVMTLGLTATACAPVPTPAQTIADQSVQGGEWFTQTGCTACHSISVYRILNIAAVGPDLSEAVEDVPKRFGRSVEDFLHAPTGTMAMVLSSRIPLTAAQRDVAIAKLHEAYRRHQGLPEPIRPLSSH